MLACLVAMAVCTLSPWAQADRIQDLETRIKMLEQQVQELKGLLQEEVQRAEAAPAGGMTLEGVSKKLKVGGDLRLRGLYFENLWDFNDDGANPAVNPNAVPDDSREVYRFRPRIYFDWQMNEDMRAYVRLSKEWFYGQDNEMPGYDVEAKDVMWDNAWVEWKDILDTGVGARVGRQDLIYGEGFVILDGTPYDGSATISFDAIKLFYPFENGNIDLFTAKLHENDFQHPDDEDLYELYVKYNPVEDWWLEPYLLYRNKNDDPSLGTDPNQDNRPKIDLSPEEETILLGLRTTYGTELTDSTLLDLAAEGGKQWGEIDFSGYANIPAQFRFADPAMGEQDRDAWAGMLSAKVTQTDWAWTPSLKGGISYFSGDDDPNDDDWEAWDDFYAQWPKFSELYVYTCYDNFKKRTGGTDPNIGVWSNMIIPEVRLDFKPTDKLGQMLRYVYFEADEDNSATGDDEMGHNIQWLTTYKFNEFLDGHFLAEWFDPGDYFVDDDEAWFIRFQLMYKF